MSKHESIKTAHAGRYVWRDKDGKIKEVDIVRSKKGPTSTSVAEIRRAVRDTNAARRKK
jgi:hypothetical protein